MPCLPFRHRAEVILLCLSTAANPISASARDISRLLTAIGDNNFGMAGLFRAAEAQGSNPGMLLFEDLMHVGGAIVCNAGI